MLPVPREVSECRALLEEVLLSFGLAEERQRVSSVARSERVLVAARATAPKDPDAYIRTHHAELLAARAVLRDLVEAIRGLRAEALLSPEAYGERWTYVVQKWNTAVEVFAWRTLPRICEACGRVLIVRGGTTCGDRCRRIVQKRRARERSAARTKKVPGGSQV